MDEEVGLAASRERPAPEHLPRRRKRCSCIKMYLRDIQKNCKVHDLQMLHFCRVDNVASYKVYACLFMSRPSNSILLPSNRDAMPDMLNLKTSSAFWYPASLL